MLAYFAALTEGTFVWTQQRDGAYRLGQIAGPWRYDGSPAACWKHHRPRRGRVP